MNNMLFEDWESITRAFLVTVLGYTSLVLAIRISGKRTLSKMNAFDFVVTVALGSCLASISLNKSVSLAEGVVVFSTLIGLQFLITWLSVRFKGLKEIFGGQPVLLLYKGEVLPEVMKRERITMQEIYVACRNSSLASLREAEVIVLETTGDITVIKKTDFQSGKSETLADVIHYPEQDSV